MVRASDQHASCSLVFGDFIFQSQEEQEKNPEFYIPSDLELPYRKKNVNFHVFMCRHNLEHIQHVFVIKHEN